MAGMRILFQPDTIARRLELLAAEITAGMGDDLTIVGILNGSFVFIADLARALDRQGCTPRIDFIRLSSYGQRQRSSGKIELIGQPPPALYRILVLSRMQKRNNWSNWSLSPI
ncbi:MAG: hypothetical protein QF546_10260 [Alphaproteobacteria bacterium]|jgi:hypoxanthine phosphoribosyltransferase|nr:hypothetical protein [Alphaproteobacteria bacterium]